MNNIQSMQDATSTRTIVKDELTVTTVPALQRKLRNALANQGPNLVMDLEQVRTIDASGIGLLIAAKNSVIAQQGQLRLVNVPTHIFNLFQSLRLVASLNAEAASNDSEEDLERYFEQAQAA